MPDQTTVDPALPPIFTATDPAETPVEPTYSVAGQVREDYARAGQWKDPGSRGQLEAESVQIARERAESIAQPHPN